MYKNYQINTISSLQKLAGKTLSFWNAPVVVWCHAEDRTKIAAMATDMLLSCTWWNCPSRLPYRQDGGEDIKNKLTYSSCIMPNFGGSKDTSKSADAPVQMRPNFSISLYEPRWRPKCVLQQTVKLVVFSQFLGTCGPNWLVTKSEGVSSQWWYKTVNKRVINCGQTAANLNQAEIMIK